MPTGNAEPSIIADAKPIIEDCIICLYIVYQQNKRFITKTNGLSAKQKVFQQTNGFGVEMVHFNYKLYRVFFECPPKGGI